MVRNRLRDGSLTVAFDHDQVLARDDTGIPASEAVQETHLVTDHGPAAVCHG